MRNDKEQKNVSDEKSRRRFLWLMGGLVSFHVLPMGVVSRMALAMGKKEYPQGMREIEGLVEINGKPAQTGDLVKPGDVVNTGENSRAVFVVGRSAFFVRDHSRIQIGSEEGSVFVLEVLKGKILSVFADGFKKIKTPTATSGIRGSAMYVEVEDKHAYICLCYGEAEIVPVSDPGQSKKITSHHHEYAYYIYGKGKEDLFEKAPMKNHTDEELVMLEQLVGRVPPFHRKKEGYESY